MHRLVIVTAFSVLVGGCSMGSLPMASFWGGDEEPKLSTSSEAKLGWGGGDITSSTSTKKASTVRAAASAGSQAANKPLHEADTGGASLDPEVALKVINDYRAEKGLKPLHLDAKLTQAAKAHSRDLAKADRISHYGTDGSTPWDRVQRTGYRPRLAAENVGTGQSSIQEVIKGWRESEGHNKNLLLPDAKHMGIALVVDPKTEFRTFWTLVVGAPM